MFVPRRVSVAACLILASVVPAPAGCGDECVAVLPLSIHSASATSGPNPGALRSPEAAVRSVASIMAKHFGLPIPDRVTVYLYPNRRAFERGLIEDARVPPARAAEMGSYAIGVGRRRQLFLEEGGGGRGQREWLRLIAHELTHVSQIELAGGEGRGEQWLVEGMAEWVAYATLEDLSLDTLTRRRVAATSGVLRYPRLIRAPLDLEGHGTPRGFTVWHLHEGTLPVYQLAFLMVDHLVERRGLDGIRGYFASFHDSRDREANFRRAFGQTLADFETDILARLSAAARLATSGAPSDVTSSSLPSSLP